MIYGIALTPHRPNDIVVWLIPPFCDSGDLPSGVHQATWEEFVARFGGSAYRRRLLGGLKRAIDSLKLAGCTTVYVDGSFVTDKPVPGDFDACWEVQGVNIDLLVALDPVLLKLDDGRAAQKAKFYGELFPAGVVEAETGLSFLDFFQVSKETGEAKGIVAIDITVIR